MGNAAKSKTTMITMKEIFYWSLVVIILVSSKQISGQSCGDNFQYCEPDTCCPKNNKCCPMPGAVNGVGCCTIENGVCCDDGVYCCFPGFTCSGNGHCSVTKPADVNMTLTEGESLVPGIRLLN